MTKRKRRRNTPRRDGCGKLELRWLDQPRDRPKGKPPIRQRPAGLTRIVCLWSCTPAEALRTYPTAILRREWRAWTAYTLLRRRAWEWRRRERIEQALCDYSAGRLRTHDAVGLARCRDYAELLVKLGDRGLPLPALPPDEIARLARLVERMMRRGR